jgi:threonine/homoserine/homoserine lactone efflux protein
VSLLPQFVDASRGPVAGQSLVLGGTQIVIALTVNALIVLTAGTVAAFLGTRPAWLRAQRWVMGGALAALAVNIIVGTLRDGPAGPPALPRPT